MCGALLYSPPAGSDLIDLWGLSSADNCYAECGANLSYRHASLRCGTAVGRGSERSFGCAGDNELQDVARAIACVRAKLTQVMISPRVFCGLLLNMSAATGDWIACVWSCPARGVIHRVRFGAERCGWQAGRAAKRLGTEQCLAVCRQCCRECICWQHERNSTQHPKLKKSRLVRQERPRFHNVPSGATAAALCLERTLSLRAVLSGSKAGDLYNGATACSTFELQRGSGR